MTDESESNTYNDLAMLDAHVAQLMEHFDSIHIFATRQQRQEDQKVSMACNSGSGSWYARLGQIHEWVVREDERIRNHHRKQSEEDE